MTDAIAGQAEQPPAPDASIRLRRLPRDPRVEYWVARPPGAGAGARVLVTVHGISRNALEHAERFMPHAAAAGVVLIAPVFSDQVFGKYQQLVPRAPDVLRSDEALLRILDDLAEGEPSVDAGRVLLFGFSGGGQFAHRFAMGHPDRVRATVVGAAGWYTMPDPGLRYPYGIGESRSRPGLVFQPERFLRNPFQVLVGPRDVSRKGVLRTSERVDAIQGKNRVERGRRWIEAMRAAAVEAGVPAPRLSFDLLAGGRHSFRLAMDRYGLGEAVMAALAREGALSAAPASARA